MSNLTGSYLDLVGSEYSVTKQDNSNGGISSTVVFICAWAEVWLRLRNGKRLEAAYQPIVRDEELIERMNETAEAFWEKIGEKWR